MATQRDQVNGVDHTKKSEYDAIVVGAGFAGLRMIVELRKLGLSFKVLEEGSGVGGTWSVSRPAIHGAPRAVFAYKLTGIGIDSKPKHES